ncbi:hypothetical protein JXL19_03095 [bacterium]|nr:hypothetical protein [bacterium]
MNDLIREVICICGATPQEIFWIKRGLIGKTIWEKGRSIYYYGSYMGKRALLVQSGIGGKNIRRSLRNLPKELKIRLALNIGCAGSLMPYMKIAHLNIPPQVRLREKDAASFNTGKEMLALACSTAGSFRASKVSFLPSMTVKSAFDREDKIALHRESPDLGCVDMESYYFASFFSLLDIPYLIIRSVSDTWNFKLPPLTYLNPFWWKRHHLIPRPIDQVPNVLRLQFAVIFACYANQRFVSRLMNVIKSWGY